MSRLRRIVWTLPASIVATQLVACGLLLGVEEASFSLPDAASLGMADAAYESDSPVPEPDSRAPNADAEADADASRDAAADAAPSQLPPCPAAIDPLALFVHGLRGDDSTGDGSDARPFKSITHALAEAKKTLAARTICVRGGTLANPIVYSEANTGEVYPLTLGSRDLLVRGEGQGLTKVSAPVPRDGGASTATPLVLLGAEGSRFEGFEIVTARKDSDRIVAIAASGAVLADTTITFVEGGRATYTVAASGRIAATIIRSNIAGTDRGIHGFNGARLTVEDSTVTGTTFCGLCASEGKATVRRSSFSGNGCGVALGCGVEFQSSDSNYSGNTVGACDGDSSPNVVTPLTASFARDKLDDNGASGIDFTGDRLLRCSSTITVSDSQIASNDVDGILASPGINYVVRRTTIAANAGSGVHILAGVDPSRVDLGTALARGENSFTADGGSNRAAGVCLEAAGMFTARGNTFATCPARTGSACTGGVDVATTVSEGNVDTADCKTP